jgi:hypothetical protein
MDSVIISQEKEKFVLKGKSKPVIVILIDLKHA